MNFKKLLTKRFLFRSWVYFRLGYGTYLTYGFSLFGTLVSVYYLMIENVPALKLIFPSFTKFTIAAVLMGLPLGIILGHMHYKRSRAYASEQDISVESNPYYFKITPGKEQQIGVPSSVLSMEASIVSCNASILNVNMNLAVIDLLVRIARSSGTLTPEMAQQCEDLSQQLKQLREVYAQLIPRYGHFKELCERLAKHGDLRATSDS